MQTKRLRITERVTETFDVDVEIPDGAVEGDETYDDAVEAVRVQYEGPREIEVTSVDYEEISHEYQDE